MSTNSKTTLRGRDAETEEGVVILWYRIIKIWYIKIMDDEVFEKAKEEDMSKDEAEELQELMDKTGLDIDEAHELWK